MKPDADRQLLLVLRLLRGESLVSVARDSGVSSTRLAGWRATFLAAGRAALNNRDQLRRTNAAALARDNEILEACLRICFSPFALPDRFG